MSIFTNDFTNSMNLVSSMTFAVCLLPKWSFHLSVSRHSMWIWEAWESWLSIQCMVKNNMLGHKIGDPYRWLRIPLRESNDFCSEHKGQMYVGLGDEFLRSGRRESKCFHVYQRVRCSWRASSPFSSPWERRCLWRSLLTCTVASKFSMDTKLHAILMALVRLMTYKTMNSVW